MMPWKRDFGRVGGWSAARSTFFNRETSWLAFNSRVLALAADDAVPLLERVRFLSIFSSNLDEFFQVRVAGLIDRVEACISKRSYDGRTASEQLDEIRSITLDLCAKQQKLLLESILPDLASHGVELLSFDELNGKERTFLGEYFASNVLPILTPLAVYVDMPLHFISDLSLNLIVSIRDPQNGSTKLARVKVPSILNRWVQINGSTRFVAQSDIVSAHLDLLFPGMEILEQHCFRVTRNADLVVGDRSASDLLAAVEMELRRRRFREAVRLEVEDSAPTEIVQPLMRGLGLKPQSLYLSSGILDIASLSEIADVSIRHLPIHHLRWPPWRGIKEPILAKTANRDSSPDFFHVLNKRDVLVHHPYSSFSYSVGEFIHQASVDPDVLAIKLTLYRTSGDSPILKDLMAASERGKQVTVLVELKARFDEAANVSWAKRLEQTGAHVIYSASGLKIHAKAAMVVREESIGIRRYCHIGTGNYNPKTATVYEDFGLFTSNEHVGDDLANFFNQLTGYGRYLDYKRLIVAPEQIREHFAELINKEIEVAKSRVDDVKNRADDVDSRAGDANSRVNGRDDKAQIIMKMNALVDKSMIEKLYEASQVGVRIELIIRSQCCLRPGVPGLSDNIKVRSIVGRYLEHSRVYHFANGLGVGTPATYIGSADLMTRNLDHRVEVLVRLESQDILQSILDTLQFCMMDTKWAWTLDANGSWTRLKSVVHNGFACSDVSRHGFVSTNVSNNGEDAASNDDNDNDDNGDNDDLVDCHRLLQMKAEKRADG